MHASCIIKGMNIVTVSWHSKIFKAQECRHPPGSKEKKKVVFGQTARHGPNTLAFDLTLAVLVTPALFTVRNVPLQVI